MRPEPRTPPTLPLAEYVEDGAYIAAILLVWGVIGGVLAVGLGSLGGPDSLLATIGHWLGVVFGVAGVINALLYVCYRTIDYWDVF